MKILLSWSSGKDSAWALHLLNQQYPGAVSALLTTVNEAMRRRSVRKIVLFGEDLDARSLAVDVDPISEVEATAALSGSGLFEVTSDFREIDR